MPHGSEYLLILLGIMIIGLMGFAWFVLSTLKKDKNNRLRKEMVMELLDKDPNMPKSIMFDLIDETIK